MDKLGIVMDWHACVCVYVIDRDTVCEAAINCWFGCRFVLPKLEVHFASPGKLLCRTSGICVNSTVHHKRGDSGTRPLRRKNGNAF